MRQSLNHNGLGWAISIALLVALCVLWFRCCTAGFAGINKEDLQKINAFRAARGLDSIPTRGK